MADQKQGKNEQIMAALKYLAKHGTVRLGVCLLPGILIAQIGAKLGMASTVGTAGTFLLIVGLIAHVIYPRVYHQMVPEVDDPAPAEENAPPTPEPIAQSEDSHRQIQLLILMYGDKERALAAAMFEKGVEPGISLAEAIDRVARRWILTAKAEQKDAPAKQESLPGAD